MKGKKPRLLIVDDERNNLNVLSEIFKDDHEIVIAKDGTQALKRAFSKTPPDLILLDIIMPDPDGFEVCRQLKADEKTKSIPIIFITAKDEIDEEKEGLEIGAVDYIRKPFSPAIVKSRVHTHLALKFALENLEIEKRAAESASLAKSEFLANMSHEVRTPLNAILGFAELLTKLIEDKQQKNYLSSIQTSGKSLLTLINDILDLSRVEAGKLEPEYSPVNLYDVFQEMQQIFSHKIASKELNFMLMIDQSLPEALMLDEVRLRQVLFNLVGNAIKFTKSGYVKLSVHKRYLTEDRSTLELVFTVEDTGIGIPKDELSSIFDVFEQQKGQSSEYEGTGLGLAITKRLVHMMDGKITLTSEEGVGSKFCVNLHDVAVASISELKEEEEVLMEDIPHFHHATILVVDDIESNRELIKEYLSSHDFSFLEAINGKEAVDLAQCYHPDLILMDMRMPFVSGYEATRQLKADESTRDIPVIALAASGTKTTEKEIRELCDHYLRKPVKLANLLFALSLFLPSSSDVFASKNNNSTLPESREAFSLQSLPPEILEKLPELLLLLEKAHDYEWKELCKTLIINNIMVFAGKMRKHGEKYDYPPLIIWGDQLYKQTEMFNLKKIRKTMNDFPNIILELRSFL